MLIWFSGFCWLVLSLEQTRTHWDKEPEMEIRKSDKTMWKNWNT